MSFVNAVARGAIELGSIATFVVTLLIICVTVRALLTGEAV